ncbi:MAG: class I SAM-dependent rRNA methyltransferase [Gammaproteobacteria bacterium]|nr:class I SAM-dependent rRNA methyltransferase [Gammaproteobacteria bacterium]
MSLPVLKLKKNEGRRIQSGHLWVYSNEIDTHVTPLSGFEPGQQVQMQDAGGKALGNAYINPHSLICARLFSRDPGVLLDRSLIVHRLNIALALRERLFDKPYYRLIYGEADELPGLVVDRFGDVLAVQITTAGMEEVKKEIVAALEKVLQPVAIVLRNDASMREMEGLTNYTETVSGKLPEQVFIQENSTRFSVPVLDGQKTGWFFDHRMNRARMQHYVSGQRVLDVFSYVGGWGVQAAQAGASEVVCVDSSASALLQVQSNAALNGVDKKVTAIEGDAFEVLRQLRDHRQRFDVVIVDPPAFIKRKKDIASGTEAYRRINQLAMRLLERDGILISASCSHHMEAQRLLGLLQKNARHVDRSMQLLEQGHQGPDHPIHPAIPETAYIKCYTMRVLPAR